MRTAASRASGFVLSALWVASATYASPTTYDFTINSGASGLNASLGFSASTSGNLIGNWDPNSNPTGTRTKPGIWGPFGDDENFPVAVSLAGGLNGNVATHPIGGFRMQLDPVTGVLIATGLAANLLGGSPASLPATTTLETEAFRTRSPSSIYPGGIPIEIPIGDATLSQLAITQTDLPAAGVLTPTGPNEYSFTVAPLVSLTAAFDLLGNPLELPATVIPFPLQGQILISGNTALLTSLQPLEFSQTQPVGQELPQFPLDLPTILPPGDTAHILMNLTLDEVAASIGGTNSLTADGVLVPEPAAGAWLTLGLVLVRGRRR